MEGTHKMVTYIFYLVLQKTAKSKAEIQKAYRERKIAKEGRAYYKRESQRKSRYYVKSSDLSERDRLKRNAANRAAVKRYNQRKKEAKKQCEESKMKNENIDQELENSKSGCNS